MNVASVEYLLAAMFGCSFFHYLPSNTIKRGALTFANAFVLWLVLPDVYSLVVLTLFLSSGFFIAQVLASKPSKVIFASYIFALVSVFVVLKRYSFLPDFMQINSTVQILGLSYMLFRQIHFIVDTMQGEIKTPNAYTYTNYQLNFMGLLAGPIQRYQDFSSYFNSPQQMLSDRYEIVYTVQRILVGMIKVAFIGSVCLVGYNEAFDHLQRGASDGIMTAMWGLKNYAIMFYLYPAYVYFNFSGYCDVVIGTAALLGLKMPENFDRPWKARNMIEFWTRQHITLGFWIRDYLFTPMYKAAAERMGTKAASYAFIFYFIALFAAGVWHGSTLNFVIFGLIHGAGVSVTKAWETYLVKKIGRKGLREYLKNAYIKAAAIFITFHFVAFAFMFFTSDVDRWWFVTRTLLQTIFGVVA
jgi:alginate O-acetyltransferase complex protein AlgI